MQATSSRAIDFVRDVWKVHFLFHTSQADDDVLVEMKRVPFNNPYTRKKVNTAAVTTSTTTATSSSGGEGIAPKPFDLFAGLPSSSNDEQPPLYSNATTTTSSNDGTTTPSSLKSLSNDLNVWQRPSVSQGLSFGSAEILTMPQACQVRDVGRSIRVTGVVLYRRSSHRMVGGRGVGTARHQQQQREVEGKINHDASDTVHLVLGDPIAPLRTSSILKEPSVKIAAAAPTSRTATTTTNTTITTTARAPIAAAGKKAMTSSVLFDKTKTKKIVFRKKTTDRRLSFAATGSLPKVDPVVQFQDVLAAAPHRLWVVAPAGTVLNVQDIVTVLGETTPVWPEEGGREGGGERTCCLVARIVRKTNGMHMKLYHDALLARQARLAQDQQQQQQDDKEDEKGTSSTTTSR